MTSPGPSADSRASYLTTLRNARDTAASLQQRAHVCESVSLKSENFRLAEHSLSVLRQVEEKAQHCDPRAAAKAAAMVYEALQRAEGRLVTAMRELKEKGWFTKFKMSSESTTRRTKSMQEIMGVMDQALVILQTAAAETPGAVVGDASNRAGTSAAVGPSIYQPQQQQQQHAPQQHVPQHQLQPQPHQQDQSGQLLNYGWGSLATSSSGVSAVNLQPGPQGTLGNLWVALRNKLEIYEGCNTKQKPTVAGWEQRQAVTCIAYDSTAKQVWTGHEDGTVKVHANGRLNASAGGAAPADTFRQLQHTSDLNVPVRALAVDARSRCWAGDEFGIIRVLVHNQQTAVVHLAKAQHIPTASAAIYNMVKLKGLVQAQSSRVTSKGMPVQAMLYQDQLMVSTGGEVDEQLARNSTSHSIIIWDAKAMEQLKEFPCTKFGAATSFAALPWDDGSDTATAASLGHAGSVGLSSVSSIRTDSSSSGGAPPPYRSGSWDGELAALKGWRLLSGHSNGQVVLWHYIGGRQRQLQQLAVIGSHETSDRSIKGLFCFSEWSMLVIAHQAGHSSSVLSVLRAPTAADVAAAVPSMAPSSTPAATLKPKMANIKAHKQPMVAVSSWGEAIVTATGSSVRSWTAAHLAQKAVETSVDLLFYRTPIRTRSRSDTGATPAAAQPEQVVRERRLSSDSQLQQQQAASSLQQAAAGSSSSRPGQAAQHPLSWGNPPPSSIGSSPPSVCSYAPSSAASSVPSSSGYVLGSRGSYNVGSSSGGGPTQWQPLWPGSGAAPSHTPAVSYGQRPPAHPPQAAGWSGYPGACPEAPAPQDLPGGALVSPSEVVKVVHRSSRQPGPQVPVQQHPGFAQVPLMQRSGLTPALMENWNRHIPAFLHAQHLPPPMPQSAPKPTAGWGHIHQLQLPAVWQTMPHAAQAAAAFAAQAAAEAQVLPFYLGAATVQQQLQGPGVGPATNQNFPALQRDDADQQQQQTQQQQHLQPTEHPAMQPPQQQQPQPQQGEPSLDVAKLKAAQLNLIGQAHDLALEPLLIRNASNLSRRPDLGAWSDAWTDADVADELAAHCGYQFIKRVEPAGMFGSSRAVQARCNRSNRLRTILQLPRRQLQQLQKLDVQWGMGQLEQQLETAAQLHHPHVVQVQEVFLGAGHLNVVLEECSAGRLLTFAQQRGGALSEDFARWFFQQLLLGVDHCHDKGVSGLPIEHTLLKVTPSLPQPVVKVATKLIAEGVSAFSIMDPVRDEDFVPPEQRQGGVCRIDDSKAKDWAKKADVWACGVLLLKLVGGTLTPTSSSSSSLPTAQQQQQVTGDLFQLPPQLQTASTLQAMLRKLLAHNPDSRYSTNDICTKDDWFRTSLPAAAQGMNARFQKTGRVCKQPEHEIKAVVAAAALHSPQQQLKQFLVKQPAAEATADLLNCLQLQSNALKQKQLQLQASIRGPDSCASVGPRLLALHQVATYAAASSKSFATALKHLQQAHHSKQQAQQQKHKQDQRSNEQTLGMAMLLQQCYSDALFQISQLEQLLQSKDLQQEAERHAYLKPRELLPHMLLLQAHILVPKQRLLASLWDSMAAADAISGAFAVQPHLPWRLPRHGRPGVLSAIATAAPHPLAAALLLPLLLVSPYNRYRRCMQLSLVWMMASLLSLTLLRLQEEQRRQRQQRQSQYRLQVYSKLEQLPAGLRVNQQPLGPKAAGTISGCVAYAGTLGEQPEQPMWVYSLPPAPWQQQQQPKDDVDEGKSDQEDTSREDEETAPPSFKCPINKTVMQDPVCAADGYTYERSAIQHWFKQRKEQKQPLTSPMMGGPMADSMLPNHNLRSQIKEWQLQQKIKRQQEQAATQQASSRKALPASAASQQDAAAQDPCRASAHSGLQRAAAARDKQGFGQLVPTLEQLQAAEQHRTRSSSSTAASSSRASKASSSSNEPLLVPMAGVCISPPLFVLPQPSSGTLEQWIRSQASSMKDDSTACFTAAWAAAMQWPSLLRLLCDTAAGLKLLHQHQPACIHGSIHAGSVHLLHKLPDAGPQPQQQQQQRRQQLSQLSLAGLLAQQAPLPSCHPLLSANECVVGAGPATTASDVYGFGILMHQLATGWLPQQYVPGSDDQIAAMTWTRHALAEAGSTSPLAAVAAAAQNRPWSPYHKGAWSPYGKHLLTVAAEQKLPAGYSGLMARCLNKVAPARPCIATVLADLQAMLSRYPVEPAAPSAASAPLAAPKAPGKQPPQSPVKGQEPSGLQQLEKGVKEDKGPLQAQSMPPMEAQQLVPTPEKKQSAPAAVLPRLEPRIIRDSDLKEQRKGRSSYLGSGSFGSVSIRDYGRTAVAMKVLADQGALQAGTDQHTLFMKEVANLQQAVHPRVVQLLGVCLDPLALVMEYCEGGSIYDLLIKIRNQQASAHSMNVLGLAMDTAEGMCFLHSLGILHRDLKSPNLFVTRHGRVKVGDLGLSSVLAAGQTRVESQNSVNAMWAAPEVLGARVSPQDPSGFTWESCKPTYSRQSDVYAFGIILWELLTMQQPWDHITAGLPAAAMGGMTIMFAVLRGERPKLPSEPDQLAALPGARKLGPLALEGYVKLMQQCWAQHPDERPGFEEVYDQLEILQQQQKEWQQQQQQQQRPK